MSITEENTTDPQNTEETGNNEPANTPTPEPELQPEPPKPKVATLPLRKAENRTVCKQAHAVRLFDDEVPGFDQLCAKLGKQMGLDGPCTGPVAIRAMMWQAIQGEGYQFPKAITQRTLIETQIF